MSAEKPKMITFHFKMDILMLNELTDLLIFQKTQNLSETICRILMQLFAIIEKKDMTGKQHFSKYKLINKNKTIKRKHVIIKIPDFLYRRLKSMHDVLNYFSIAQLLRVLLRWFLRLVKKFANEYGKKLIRLTKKWANFSENSHFLIKYIHQLITFKGKIKKIIEIFYIYALHFSPYRVFR